jgi:hypothetical protein
LLLGLNADRAPQLKAIVRWLSPTDVDMSCECERLPHVFNLEKYSNRLKKRLTEVEVKSDGWVKLCQCRACGQYWQLDEWDKYQTLCAIKISDPANWQTYDDQPDRARLLIESRGGLSEEECVMARCQNKALKSLAYCPAHAYEIGIRE